MCSYNEDATTISSEPSEQRSLKLYNNLVLSLTVMPVESLSLSLHAHFAPGAYPVSVRGVSGRGETRGGKHKAIGNVIGLIVSDASAALTHMVRNFLPGSYCQSSAR